MADMRYNPPPNWPAPPEGWSPPPGWDPDPAWGPAPHGWPLWLEAAATTPSGPAAPTAPLPLAPPAAAAATRADEAQARKKSHLPRNLIIAGIIVAIISIALAANGGGGAKKPKAALPGQGVAATTPAPISTTSTDSSDNSYTPVPSDFTLKVKITKKDCFGSAGCNIEFHIVPTYTGATFSGTYDVTYKVSGDSDGPQVDSFTIDEDGTATYDSVEIASTNTSHQVLKAVPTSVEPDGSS